MCKLYKTLNQIFYRFAQMLFLGAVLALPSGVAYLIYASIVLKLNLNDILENNIFIYYFTYILTALVTGLQISKKYEKYQLEDYEQINDSNFFELKINIKG